MVQGHKTRVTRVHSGDSAAGPRPAGCPFSRAFERPYGGIEDALQRDIEPSPIEKRQRKPEMHHLRESGSARRLLKGVRWWLTEWARMKVRT